TLAMLHKLIDADLTVPVHLLTSGAVAAAEDEGPNHPLQAMVWGLGRVIALEHPQRWGGLIDLPAEPDAAALDRLCGLLASSGGENQGEAQVAIRPAGVWARRLVRAPLATAELAAPSWRPGGAVLVTGGSGTLGPHIARWLARCGAEHIVLTSRRCPRAPGMAELQAELGAEGIRVTVAACDVADRSQVADLLGRLRGEGVEIRSVVHA